MNKKNLTLKDAFLYAVQSYKKKDFEEAEIECHRILSIDPRNFESNLLLASISVAKKDYNNAKKILEEANSIKPNNLSVLNYLGSVFSNLKEFNDAEVCYKKVLDYDPNNINAHYNYGLLYLELKEFKKAKTFFEKTINLQPNFALAFLALANIHADEKDYENSVKNYQKAIELRPNLVSAHNNLGLVFRKLNDPKSAISCYEKVIKLKINHSGAHHNLALALKESGKFEEAILAHKNAIKHEPENLMHYFYLYDLDKNILDIKLKNKIEEIINDTKITKSNLVFANYLMSKYEKKSNNYEKELNYLIVGHKNYYNSNKKNFDLKTKYCFEDLVKISQETRVKKFKEITKNNMRPIFIIGVPRSGSTLIEKIIGSGEKHIPMGEEAAVLENFINSKIMEKRSLELGEGDELRGELYSIFKNKGLVQEKYNFIFTDKSLNNFFYLHLIKNIFPESKIINCRRNVISSIMSIMQNNLSELAWAHDLKNIFTYFDNYFKIINSFDVEHPGVIYKLDFEKFTKTPIEESKRLLDFCGLPWNEKCLEFYKRKDLVSKTTSNVQIRKSVYKDSQNKYLPYKNLLNLYGKKYSWYN